MRREHIESDASAVAPAGLIYSFSSVVYPVGQSIEPNTPRNSEGTISHYSVAPALPAGLSLDRTTGMISGTPVATAGAALYSITGENKAGRTAARVQIEVRRNAIAPETLRYHDTAPVYSTGVAIVPNRPLTTGGEVTNCSVDKPLPAGLSLDPASGVITGTPSAITAATVYTVTGANSAGSVTTSLIVEVRSTPAPPASLSYSDPDPAYLLAQPIAANVPGSTGGEITQYSVTPPLPQGLSLNSATGEIAGAATELSAKAPYTVTGTNRFGSVSTIVSITVIPVGEFSPTDSMDVARAEQTETLLQDGKLLVTGGVDSINGKASAELYDPNTGAWSVTSSMTTQRYRHTATLLPNGKVLVAGGGNGRAQSSAELYDPATGTWSVTGSMLTQRVGFTSTTLPDGNVLAAGGTLVGDGRSAELYNPGTGTWSATGGMTAARLGHTATRLTSGMVLVAGGRTSLLVFEASTELYDPATGTWSPVENMNTARSGHTATLLPNGNVLIAERHTRAVEQHRRLEALALQARRLQQVHEADRSFERNRVECHERLLARFRLDVFEYFFLVIDEEISFLVQRLIDCGHSTLRLKMS